MGWGARRGLQVARGTALLPSCQVHAHKAWRATPCLGRSRAPSPLPGDPHASASPLGSCQSHPLGRPAASCQLRSALTQHDACAPACPHTQIPAPRPTLLLPPRRRSCRCWACRPATSGPCTAPSPTARWACATHWPMTSSAAWAAGRRARAIARCGIVRAGRGRRCVCGAACMRRIGCLLPRACMHACMHPARGCQPAVPLHILHATTTI